MGAEADRDKNARLGVADLLRLIEDEVAEGLDRAPSGDLDVAAVRVRLGVAPSAELRAPWRAARPRPVLAAPALMDRAGWQIELELSTDGGSAAISEQPISGVDSLRDRSIGTAFATLGLGALRGATRLEQAQLSASGLRTLGDLADLADETLEILTTRTGSARTAALRTQARLVYQALPPLPGPPSDDPSLVQLVGLSPRALAELLELDDHTAQRLAETLGILAVALTEKTLAGLSYADLRQAQEDEPHRIGSLRTGRS